MPPEARKMLCDVGWVNGGRVQWGLQESQENLHPKQGDFASQPRLVVAMWECPTSVARYLLFQEELECEFLFKISQFSNVNSKAVMTM